MLPGPSVAYVPYHKLIFLNDSIKSGISLVLVKSPPPITFLTLLLIFFL